MQKEIFNQIKQETEKFSNCKFKIFASKDKLSFNEILTYKTTDFYTELEKILNEASSDDLFCFYAPCEQEILKLTGNFDVHIFFNNNGLVQFDKTVKAYDLSFKYDDEDIYTNIDIYESYEDCLEEIYNYPVDTDRNYQFSIDGFSVGIFEDEIAAEGLFRFYECSDFLYPVEQENLTKEDLNQ